MKITSINAQQKDANRVSIFVDNIYSFSLDISQLVEFGLKTGIDVNDLDVERYKKASSLGKLYVKAVEFCFARPRSVTEIKKYLFRKNLSTKNATDTDNKLSDQSLQDILNKLIDKGYVDDYKFAKYWADNRFLKKGLSKKRLKYELSQKGVNSSIIESVLTESERNDNLELKKIIIKKINKYPDKVKFAQYLMRQGFSYGDIKTELDMIDY